MCLYKLSVFKFCTELPRIYFISTPAKVLSSVVLHANIAKCTQRHSSFPLGDNTLT